MKRNRLLESLTQDLGSKVVTRRYNLADLISESYKLVFQCSDDTNFRKLAESHLADVKNNPRDLERLSRQLCIMKEVAHLVESNELKDEDLVDKKNYDEVEPKKERVLQKECNESAGDWDAFKKSDEYKETYSEWKSEMRSSGHKPPFDEDEFEPTTMCNDAYKRWQKDNKVEESKITESDNPDLTDEELEELAKHLETIRKERKEAPKKEMTEEAEPEAPVRRGIKCHMSDSKKPEKLEEEETPDRYVVGYGVDIVVNEGQPDVETRIEMALYKVGLNVVGCQPTGASWSVKEYEDEVLGYSIDESKKVNESDEEMIKVAVGKKYMGKGLKSEYREKYGYRTVEIPKSAMIGSTKFDKKALVDGGYINDDESVFYVEESKKVNEEKVVYDLTKGEEANFLIVGEKCDYKIYAKSSRDAFNKFSTLIRKGKVDQQDIKVEKISESKSYRGLENFKKQSESKAFYKTFKKMHESLKEGKALTRQESIDLYKASNSALTQLSIELEHNPEFLDTFKESVSILSKDVNSLLESLTRGKAPSKNTMKSLAKFSEALLFEAEEKMTSQEAKEYWEKNHNSDPILSEYDSYEAWYKDSKDNGYIDDPDEDIEESNDEEDEVAMDPEAEEKPPVEETPEEDFVGDDEGDVQSEEADAFDQEYADARVELHKELVAKHGDDPDVQDKIAQDAEEVTNLPGITDEQIAEINGEEVADEENPEEPEGDEEVEPEEDDSEITDDELEELKKHLQEMRTAKRLKESEEVSDLVERVKKALDDAGIKYSTRGRSTLIVAKKDLDKASELRDKIDPNYKVTVGTPA